MDYGHGFLIIRSSCLISSQPIWKITTIKTKHNPKHNHLSSCLPCSLQFQRYLILFFLHLSFNLYDECTEWTCPWRAASSEDTELCELQLHQEDTFPIQLKNWLHTAEKLCSVEQMLIYIIIIKMNRCPVIIPRFYNQTNLCYYAWMLQIYKYFHTKKKVRKRWWTNWGDIIKHVIWSFLKRRTWINVNMMNREQISDLLNSMSHKQDLRKLIPQQLAKSK